MKPITSLVLRRISFPAEFAGGVLALAVLGGTAHGQSVPSSWTKPSASPATLLERARQDQSLADLHASDAMTLARSGDFERARIEAMHAVSHAPGDPAMQELLATIDSMQHRTQTLRLSNDIRSNMQARRLNAASAALPELLALTGPVPATEALQLDLDARWAKVSELRSNARLLMQDGRFDESTRLFEQAFGLVADDRLLQEELDASRAQRDLSQLIQASGAALDRGDFAGAMDLASEALEISDDPSARGLHRAAEVSMARSRVRSAWGDDVELLFALRAQLALESNAEAQSELARVERRIADGALRASNEFRVRDLMREAEEALASASQLVSDPRLRLAADDLRAELFFRRAVRAEQQGQLGQAEKLYLDALHAGGDRVAISARLDNLTGPSSGDLRGLESALVQAERARDEAQREILSLQQYLRNRDSKLREAERDWRDLDREFHVLERDNINLKNALQAERNRRGQLEHRVSDLKCEVDRLCREVDRWKHESERLRREYNRLRRRG